MLKVGHQADMQWDRPAKKPEVTKETKKNAEEVRHGHTTSQKDYESH